MARDSDGTAFIQYKGTDLCADIYCDCGTHLHVDAYFAYAVQCDTCKAIWEFPQFVTLTKVESSQFKPLPLKEDDY